MTITMEELEQKAKRYDEVLAMAQECVTYIPDETVKKYMLDMFPELKESRDEEIRKLLIKLFKSNTNEKFYDVSTQDILAWLEKQGERKPAWSEEDERICQCLIEDQEESLDKVSNDKYGHSEIISDLKEMYGERIDWLKTLKERKVHRSTCGI